MAVSPDLFLSVMEDRFVTSAEDFDRELSAVVEELAHALERNEKFADEVKKRQRPDNRQIN